MTQKWSWSNTTSSWYNIKNYEDYKIPILQVYGSTETAPIAICQKISENRSPFGNVGKIAKYNKAKIFNKNYKEAHVNTVGEIGIKGLNLFSYYWNDKHKTSQAFKNGWFMTGDFGKKDHNSKFYVIGRTENIINIRNKRAVRFIKTFLL